MAGLTTDSSKLTVPYTTPAASNTTLGDNKTEYEMSSVTLEKQPESQYYAPTLLADTEHRNQRQSQEMPKNRTEEILEEIKQETASHEGEDEQEYPSSFKLMIITAALCLGILCMALDNTIIATAIPKITDQFAGSIQDVGWFGSAYLLTACAFQLWYGKLYTFFSIKWVFLSALSLFEVGSVICGAAPNAVALIVGRAVAGLGAAGIFSGAMLIIAHAVPLAKRPIYSGIIGGMYGIASVMGPLLGGVFTDKVSWRWCFYINLPLGAVTLLFIFFFFDSPKRAQSMSHLTWREKLGLMDLEGTAVFVPMIICVLLALQWGGSKYPWHDGRIIALFVLFGVLLLVFVGIQVWKGDKATVPPRILKNRSIAGCAVFIACLGGSFFALIYYVPIFFQSVQNVSAVESGIRNLPLVLTVTVFSVISGAATTAFGYYTPWIIASSVLISIGAGLISTWHPGVKEGAWIGYQIIYGAGVGVGIQMPMMAVQAVLSTTDIATGTAIIIFFQTFGGALFIAVAENVFLNKIYSNMAIYAPGFSADVVATTGATSLHKVVPPEYIQGVVQAYSASLDQTFYVAVAMAALSLFGAVFVEWKSVKGQKMEMGGA